MGRIFKTPDFANWAENEGVADEALISAVKEMEDGLMDANLGGSVYKKRVARNGQGKSGGFRTLIAFKGLNNSFFLYGFAKNERDNISKKEKTALKALAKEMFSYSDEELKKALNNSSLIEVIERGNEK
ncbi:type II toxin-antitoxin system RelE/ParE family toxin [Shewanella sp. KCT]|uniref:type II toxin-antitoxin system RelE/ParE family toxin n=1 Tax=Shewanella sp. KCT TaxID=2569535 RepID=UPI00118332EB|nr:type II toxin-antitoxin system RelE/ParE family toxin [Shewanella sp. KCT]TVP11812.1 hypothetical protein AYI87_15395 [Shewanella sp. KCT]